VINNNVALCLANVNQRFVKIKLKFRENLTASPLRNARGKPLPYSPSDVTFCITQSDS
jgi:hypothetical protein